MVCFCPLIADACSDLKTDSLLKKLGQSLEENLMVPTYSGKFALNPISIQKRQLILWQATLYV